MNFLKALILICVICIGINSHANWTCEVFEHDQVKSLTLIVNEDSECLLYKKDGSLYGQPFSNLSIKSDGEGLEVSDGEGLILMYFNFAKADGYFSGLEQFLNIENCREHSE